MAIEAGDEAAATTAVEQRPRRRRHGPGRHAGARPGWSASGSPCVGSSIRDARHLGDALDSVTSVAEVGAEIYPEITGDDSTFFTNGSGRHPHPAAAGRQRRRRPGRAGPGPRRPWRRSTATGPGAARLADGPRRGPGPGAAPARRPDVIDAARSASCPTSSARRGRAEVPRRDPQSLRAALLRRHGPDADPDHRARRPASSSARPSTPRPPPTCCTPRYWRKVKGNPFHNGPHASGQRHLAPSWPVSGEETLNAWRSVRGRNMSGLFAVDVVTLARLARDHRPDGRPRLRPGRRRTTSSRPWSAATTASPTSASARPPTGPWSPLFVDRLLRHRPAPGQGPRAHRGGPGPALRGLLPRPGLQEAMQGLSIAGDLSAHRARLPRRLHPERRTQQDATTGSHAQVRSDVRLRPDGSAKVSLEVEMHNDSPPYVGTDARLPPGLPHALGHALDRQLPAQRRRREPP